jgi:hypothetical protein
MQQQRQHCEANKQENKLDNDATANWTTARCIEWNCVLRCLVVTQAAPRAQRLASAAAWQEQHTMAATPPPPTHKQRHNIHQRTYLSSGAQQRHTGQQQ